MTEPIVIAIDGPAGAGKSTVAQKVAERLRLGYVDSGATYRASALKAFESGVSLDDEAAITELIAGSDIQFSADGSRVRIFLDRQDVSQKIRTPEVTLAAAKVSRLPGVREKLVSLQRGFARDRGVVMEGRDIGTVVFPDAPLKIFLQADPQVRARRRLEQERQQGRWTTLEQTAYEIGRRDELDSGRKISPLVAAPDACLIDSTHLTVDQVVEQILKLAKEKKLVEG